MNKEQFFRTGFYFFVGSLSYHLVINNGWYTAIWSMAVSLSIILICLIKNMELKKGGSRW